ncbi:hypothetical protein ACLI4Z_01270 [Natrialbaceae archaeon A-arb3/5]
MGNQPFRDSVRSTIETGVSTVTDVRFEPNTDTVVALVTLLALWVIYFVQSASESVASVLVFLLVGNLFLTVLFPIYYVCYVRSEPLSAVGITADGWKRALIASTIAALVLLPGLLTVDEPLAVLLPHVVTVGLMIWEPLFVHGWLQIRFERAFGAGLGIVLAAAAFVLFHVGSVALTGLVVLAVFGAVHATLFRAFDRNLLVLWPILWAVGSSQGTLDSVVFGWEEASAYAVIVLVAGAAVYATMRRTSE